MDDPDKSNDDGPKPTDNPQENTDVEKVEKKDLVDGEESKKMTSSEPNSETTQEVKENGTMEDNETQEQVEQRSESGKGDAASERAVSISTIQMAPAAISDSQLEEDETMYAALRGKANTPASIFTDLTDGKGTRSVSRPSAGARTQEAFYRKAVDLISARCSSTVKMVSTEPLMGVKDPPPGFGAPRVFYIHQRRPRPMTPLKVWRGYHGNVYFEPMKINQASLKEQTMEVTLPPMNRCSEKLQMVISQTRWNPEHTLQYRRNRMMYTPIAQEVPPQERYKNQTRPVLVLDRETVKRDADNLEVLKTLESTGTLRIQTAGESLSHSDSGTFSMSSQSRIRSPAQKPDKSKLCKGSVARKLVMFRNLMIPLMQDQLEKSSPNRSPTESRADLQSRETPTKLPSITPKSSRTPVLRIK